MYQKWINKEKEWIREYCVRTQKESISKVFPLVLVVSVFLFGFIFFVDSGSMVDLFVGVLGGLIFGSVISIIYFFIIYIELNPNRYIRMIEKNVVELSMTEEEKEQLGQEMLETLENKKQVLYYEMSGARSNNTPARVMRTPHYYFQVGSTPYSNLIRISDIAFIQTGSERKLVTTRNGNRKRHHYITLYTIGFYRKDRNEREVIDNELPDYAMGFFQEDLRKQALEMIQSN